MSCVIYGTVFADDRVAVLEHIGVDFHPIDRPVAAHVDRFELADARIAEIKHIAHALHA